MNNLTKRILTGSIYVATMLWATTNPTFLGVLLLVVAILAVRELNNIFEKQDLDFDLWPTTLLGIATYASVLQPTITPVLISGIFIYFISTLYRPTKNALQLIGGLLLAIFYIFIPLSLASPVALQSGTYEHKTLIGLFILIWSSDSWAYVSGRALGKRKLFERLSPNKTWEGFWGSVILTSLTGYIISLNGFGLSNIEWITLGAITVFVATAGDLFQSMLKRTSNIKDSGNILPGHGGILDRFDSILFCLPAYYIYFYYLSPALNF
jgi:phosphatidate cytidylyltransferase